VKVGTLVASACLALSMCACAGNQQQASAPQSAAPAAMLTNDTGLPLPQDASIIDSRVFHQTIDPAQGSGSALAAAGKGTYTGHEVIASSNATEADLATWLATVPAPAGMKKTDTGSKVKVGADTLDSVAHRYGIDYVAFVSPSGKGATVVVMDPKIVTTKLGPVMSLLDKYNALPASMRQAMDGQIKQHTGFSIAELTDKSAPLGAAIAAVNQFRNSDKRAIILVSGEKTQ
jgi:hypothetical protein